LRFNLTGGCAVWESAVTSKSVKQGSETRPKGAKEYFWKPKSLKPNFIKDFPVSRKCFQENLGKF